MAKKQNRNNNLTKGKNKTSSGNLDCEYDLEKNFRKINSYSRNRRNKGKSYNPITDSRDSDNSNLGSQYVETPINTSFLQRTGDGSAWDSYARLDDKITDFNYKNDQAHTELRKELESKIKDSIATLVDSIKECKDDIFNRLSTQWYIWTIIGLVAIVTVWYIFSYQDVHPLPRQVQEIDKRLNVMEKKIDIIVSDTIQSAVK